jgi:glycosyltransferase involved in cell wall biosynthesis
MAIDVLYFSLYIEPMKISVIVPAHNEEKMIAACLQALTEADKPEGEWEIIVVNNASTDRTEEMARSFSRVRLVEESEKGLTKARECGRGHAQGEILMYVDADTQIPKHLIRYVEEQFDADPELVAMSGPYKYHDWHRIGRLLLWSYHWTIVPLTQLAVNRILNKGCIFYGANFALRKSVLDKIGGFDTSLEFWSEDTQIGRRMGREGKVRFFHRAYTYTSARRFYKEGTVRVLGRYILNYLWDILFHRPFSKGYEDVRGLYRPFKASVME